MGFCIYIEDSAADRPYKDKEWDGGNYAYQSEFFALVGEHCTDVREYDRWTDGRPSEYRPTNQAEIDSLREAVRTSMRPEQNQSLYLHLVDQLEQNPNLRIIPSY